MLKFYYPENVESLENYCKITFMEDDANYDNSEIILHCYLNAPRIYVPDDDLNYLELSWDSSDINESVYRLFDGSIYENITSYDIAIYNGEDSFKFIFYELLAINKYKDGLVLEMNKVDRNICNI